MISYVILRKRVRHKFCSTNTHMKCERKMTTLWNERKPATVCKWERAREKSRKTTCAGQRWSAKETKTKQKRKTFKCQIRTYTMVYVIRSVFMCFVRFFVVVRFVFGFGFGFVFALTFHFVWSIHSDQKFHKWKTMICMHIRHISSIGIFTFDAKEPTTTTKKKEKTKIGTFNGIFLWLTIDKWPLSLFKCLHFIAHHYDKRSMKNGLRFVICALSSCFSNQKPTGENQQQQQQMMNIHSN